MGIMAAAELFSASRGPCGIHTTSIPALPLGSFFSVSVVLY